ncbi:MAG: 3-hydroxyisobutyryl-CoA hydrolase [Aeromicrobium sp.]|uniref:3-hydroxyisobutyryl-CoA hydrolase n=1 Tax=Aeromicrobium sp. TaxID=1871063 RepID=UPI0039E6F07E
MSVRPMFPQASDSGVRAERVGRAARLTLTRPDHLNALHHPMVRALRRLIRQVADDPGAEVIVLSGEGRGLCAGGDLLFFHRSITADDGAAVAFWRDLYGLTHDIATSPVPVVSLLDGFVFGGGFGVASRAAVRVVTERSHVGMPETRIGFYPDTGGLHLLSHARGEVGTCLGLCAQTIGAREALDAGLAERFTRSVDLPRLLDLLSLMPMEEALDEVCSPAPAGPSWDDRPWVEECFAGDDPQAILDRLLAHDDSAARAAGETLATRSPTMVAATLRGLRHARSLSVPEDLAFELRLSEALHRHPDFREGIRARLIDKDGSPAWTPASLADVDLSFLDPVFVSEAR